MRFIPQTLQNKFLLGLVIILLLMGGLFSIALYAHTRDLLTSEAREKATLMMAHTEAIQGYVRKVLRPSISKIIPPDDFVIEAMSTSYVSRHILSSLSVAPNSFTYRRVAQNARNPNYEVSPTEAFFFNTFKENPTLTRLEKIIAIDGEKHLSVSRPIYFSKDCMWCHGEPEKAPAVLLEKYGSVRGFYRNPGELAGIEFISVPLHGSSGAIGQSASLFALWFSSGMIILLFFLQLFFNRLVVHNLKRVGAILQRTFFQTSDEELLAPMHQAEEIEGMIHSIEAIATHLGDTREQLNTYAKNLEEMVKKRTQEMEKLVVARSADVDLFVQLLDGLNQYNEKKVLLCTSLHLVSQHFNATTAFYTCATNATDTLFWPACTQYKANAEKELSLDDYAFNKIALLNLEKPLIEKDYWLFPVQTSGQLRGVIGLFWEQGQQPPHASDISLALTFGTQLGIALDNLEAIDALLHQNTLLDNLVEGVPDPLILADASGVPLLANSSAKQLAKRLHNLLLKETDPMPNAQFSSKEATHTELITTLVNYMNPIENNEKIETKKTTNEERTHEQSLPDGSSFAVGIYPLQSTAHQITKSVIHIHETTEEKAMLTHLRHNEKLAAVGQLAASIAHEINNPLGVIRCYAELLEKSFTTEQEKADIAIILKHVDGARGVLSDLLHFARPKTEKYEECNIELLLNSLLELFKPKIAKAHIEIFMHTAPNIPHIYTDSGMLEQVLVNLLLNALEAITHNTHTATTQEEPTPTKQGEITITTTLNAQKETINIRIADNAGGIEEADLSKIFDPFFTTRAIGEGTGLGLTVAFGMIREMGGYLEVSNHYKNKKRKGAEFTLTLPIHGHTASKILKNEVKTVAPTEENKDTFVHD